MSAIYQWMVNVLQGVCGTTDDVVSGNLLGVYGCQSVLSGTNVMQMISGGPHPVQFTDTKIFSFTFAMARATPPLVGDSSVIMQFHAASRIWLMLDVTSTGSIRMRAKDSTADYRNYPPFEDIGLILDVEITNNGASLCDGELRMFTAIINLGDATKREIKIDNLDVTENPNYVTWNTYIDAVIPFAGSGYGSAQAVVGGDVLIDSLAFNDSDEASDTDGVACLGFIGFNDTCDLIAPAVWDSAGWIRDPGKWEGWYKTQPLFFYTSYWRNTGRAEPSNDSDGTESTHGADYSYLDNWQFPPGALLNRGIGGKITPTGIPADDTEWNFACSWQNDKRTSDGARNVVGNSWACGPHYIPNVDPHTSQPFSDTITIIGSLFDRTGWSPQTYGIEGLFSIATMGHAFPSLWMYTDSNRLHIQIYDTVLNILRYHISIGDEVAGNLVADKWYQYGISLDASSISYAMNGTNTPDVSVIVNNPGPIYFSPTTNERCWWWGPAANSGLPEPWMVTYHWPGYIVGAAALDKVKLDFSSATVRNRIWDINGQFKNPGEDGYFWFSDTYAGTSPDIFMHDGSPRHTHGGHSQDWKFKYGGGNGFNSTIAGLKKQYT